MKLIIFKKQHYSTFIPRIYRYKDINKSVYISFNKSCLYNILEKKCVNKLWGFSCGLFGVHTNSYRFGWTSEEDKIVIWSYIYFKGKLYKKKIYTCDLDITYKFTISFMKNTVVFLINEKIIFKHSLEVKPKLLLELGFYFGGYSKSPHKMWVNFKRKL